MRDIKCTFCGHHGKIEAHDTVDSVNHSEIFKLMGKTDDGFIIFGCPKCGEHIQQSPYSMMAKGCLSSLIMVFLPAGFLIYYIF